MMSGKNAVLIIVDWCECELKLNRFSMKPLISANFHLTVMKAKFATSCIACGDKISPGKEISKNEQGKWVHKHCAPEEELL